MTSSKATGGGGRRRGERRGNPFEDGLEDGVIVKAIREGDVLLEETRVDGGNGALAGAHVPRHKGEERGEGGGGGGGGGKEGGGRTSHVT